MLCVSLTISTQSSWHLACLSYGWDITIVILMLGLKLRYGIAKAALCDAFTAFVTHRTRMMQVQ